MNFILYFSKRTREVVEISPEQPKKVAKLTQSNEIEAALSSSKRYQKQKADAKKKRAGMLKFKIIKLQIINLVSYEIDKPNLKNI